MKKPLSCQGRGRAVALISILHSETQKDACEGIHSSSKYNIQTDLTVSVVSIFTIVSCC